MPARKFTRVNFANADAPIYNNQTGLVMAAADNEVETMYIDGNYFEYIQTGANTDLVFTKGTQGFTIPNDNTDNEGIELTQGILASSNMSFVIGTDEAFQIYLRYDIPDVSDYDVSAVGFRIAAAYVDITAPDAAGFTGYTDYAYHNVNAGTVNLNTGVNGTDVDTNSTDTWADGDEKAVRVRVSGAGAVTYAQTTGNAAADTTLTATQGAVAFTFDTGDRMIPTMAWTKLAAVAADTPPILVRYECSFQSAAA